jgi:hypothetical protein
LYYAQVREQPVQVRRALIVTSVAMVVAVVTVLAAVSITLAKLLSGGFGSCPAQGQMAVVEGETVALQDRAFPGRDPCDVGRTHGTGDINVLGFDCRVRTPAGEVVASTTPNRADGTCGQP